MVVKITRYKKTVKGTVKESSTDASNTVKCKQEVSYEKNNEKSNGNDNSGRHAFNCNAIRRLDVYKRQVVYKDKKEKFDYSKMDSKDLLNIINCKNVDEQGYLLWAKIGDTKISGDLFAKALGLQSTSLQIDECEKGISCLLYTSRCV